MKGKISSINHLRDKDQAKIFFVAVILEDQSTTGGEFYAHDGSVPFKVGDELEFEIEQSPYGAKFKLPKAAKAGGGWAKKTPEQEANLNAIAITKSMIESNQLDGQSWFPFYMETYEKFLNHAKTGLPF